MTSSTAGIDNDAELVVVSLQSGRDSTDSRQEDSTFGRIVIDLDTGLASGVLSAVTGRGDDNNFTIAFSDYDITSGESILTNATVVGDAMSGVSIQTDFILSLDVNGDLVVERPAAFADAGFETLISVQSFDRLSEGSAAVSLGSSSAIANHVPSLGSNTSFDLDVPVGAETATITLSMGNIVTDGFNDNENRGTATIFVDLVNLSLIHI